MEILLFIEIMELANLGLKKSTNSVTMIAEMIYSDKVHLPVEYIDLLSLYSHSNNDNGA